jgi:hypothetical protein
VVFRNYWVKPPVASPKLHEGSNIAFPDGQGITTTFKFTMDASDDPKARRVVISTVMLNAADHEHLYIKQWEVILVLFLPLTY